MSFKNGDFGECSLYNPEGITLPTRSYLGLTQKYGKRSTSVTSLNSKQHNNNQNQFRHGLYGEKNSLKINQYSFSHKRSDKNICISKTQKSPKYNYQFSRQQAQRYLKKDQNFQFKFDVKDLKTQNIRLLKQRQDDLHLISRQNEQILILKHRIMELQTKNKKIETCQCTQFEQKQQNIQLKNRIIHLTTQFQKYKKQSKKQYNDLMYICQKYKQQIDRKNLDTEKQYQVEMENKKSQKVILLLDQINKERNREIQCIDRTLRLF